VILTGIRIVLVQNIRTCDRRRAIGAGGFGVFVSSGDQNQTAIDLVLLGELANCRTGFSCAVLLDALVKPSIGPRDDRNRESTKLYGAARSSIGCRYPFRAAQSP